MTAPILQTRNLNRSFGAVTAARDLNVALMPGEIVGVIGSNGAGKTTFINMATGYLAPSSGEISFRGESILGLAPRQITRRGMGRSFQIAQLFPELSVLRNMLIALATAEGGRLAMLRPLSQPDRIARADTALDEFGVTRFRDVPVRVVPQGARKLIDIAMATIGNPALLLLDEPTSGVSVDEKFGLMDAVMAAVRRQSTTVLFVEHDMEIVARYVSRILAFYQGEIIADGPPDAVLGDARVQEFVTGHGSHARKRNPAA